jgi:hypothetical protein
MQKKAYADHWLLGESFSLQSSYGEFGTFDAKQNKAYAGIWLLGERLGLHTPHGQSEALDAKKKAYAGHWLLRESFSLHTSHSEFGTFGEKNTRLTRASGCLVNVSACIHRTVS